MCKIIKLLFKAQINNFILTINLPIVTRTSRARVVTRAYIAHALHAHVARVTHTSRRARHVVRALREAKFPKNLGITSFSVQPIVIYQLHIVKTFLKIYPPLKTCQQPHVAHTRVMSAWHTYMTPIIIIIYCKIYIYIYNTEAYCEENITDECTDGI